MNKLNLLYNAIENNNLKTVQSVICLIDESDLVKFNNKALSMAYVHENYDIFDYLVSFDNIFQFMKNDPDKTLLNFYKKRKLKKDLNLF